MEYRYYLTLFNAATKRKTELALTSDAVLTRTSVDGRELLTSTVELLWKNSQELITNELEAMTLAEEYKNILSMLQELYRDKVLTEFQYLSLKRAIEI